MVTKEIQLHTAPLDCPSHPRQHKAVLYKWPHRYGGIWECPISGESGTHDHEDLKKETVFEDRFGHEDIYQVERQVYICGVCLVTLELDPSEIPV